MSFEKEEHEKLLLLYSEYKNAYFESKNYLLTHQNINLHKAHPLLLKLLDDLRQAQLKNIKPETFFNNDQKGFTNHLLKEVSFIEDLNKFIPYIYGCIFVSAYFMFFGVKETYLQLYADQFNKIYIIPFFISVIIAAALIYTAAQIIKSNSIKNAFKPKKIFEDSNLIPYLIYGIMPIILIEFKNEIHLGPKQYIPWYVYWIIIVILIIIIKQLTKPFRKYYKQKSSPN